MKKFLGLSLIVLLVGSVQALEVPYLSGRIVDEANIIDASSEQNLIQLLKTHEDQTGDQIAVLTLPSLEGDSLEDFTTRVFEKWQLGQKGKDNGILFLVVPNDRKMRIEVGYGLEGKIPDAIASQIIRNVAAPAFKQQNYSGGISAVVGSLVKILESEPGQYDYIASGPPPTEQMDTKSKIIIGLFFSVFYSVLIFGVAHKSKIFKALVTMVWLGGSHLIFVANNFLGVLILFFGIFGFLILLSILQGVFGRERFKNQFGFNFNSGGSGYGGGSSWSSGGGGFSGGGGSSGGGGASGSW